MQNPDRVGFLWRTAFFAIQGLNCQRVIVCVSVIPFVQSSSAYCSSAHCSPYARAFARFVTHARNAISVSDSDLFRFCWRAIATIESESSSDIASSAESDIPVLLVGNRRPE